MAGWNQISGVRRASPDAALFLCYGDCQGLVLAQGSVDGTRDLLKERVVRFFL
jgi:hypothetical protein